MEIVLASDQERPNLFAEVHHEGRVWAEVLFDDDRQRYRLTIFPPGSGPDPAEYMEFDFEEAVGGLRDALEALVLRGFPELER